MSLTKDDLRSIKDIVEDAKEDIKIDVAAGFAEVHEKFAEVNDRIDQVDRKLSKEVGDIKGTVGRIENVQRAEITRADKHSRQITKLKKQLA